MAGYLFPKKEQLPSFMRKIADLLGNDPKSQAMGAANPVAITMPKIPMALMRLAKTPGARIFGEAGSSPMEGIASISYSRRPVNIKGKLEARGPHFPRQITVDEAKVAAGRADPKARTDLVNTILHEQGHEKSFNAIPTLFRGQARKVVGVSAAPASSILKEMLAPVYGRSKTPRFTREQAVNDLLTYFVNAPANIKNALSSAYIVEGGKRNLPGSVNVVEAMVDQPEIAVRALKPYARISKKTVDATLKYFLENPPRR